MYDRNSKCDGENFFLSFLFDAIYTYKNARKSQMKRNAFTNDDGIAKGKQQQQQQHNRKAL